MCTLAVKKLNGGFFLFKNRDREYFIDTRVTKEKGKTKKLLITDQRGHCEGINEFGVGLIEATLQPYPKVKCKSPSQIARRILDQNNIKDALRIVEKSNVSANMIIADSDSAYVVEKTPYEFYATKVRTQGAITNLSIKLNKENGAHYKPVRDWARARYLRAKVIIKDIKSFEDIKKFLTDKKGWPDKSICSGEPWWITTKCSFVFDLKNRKIFFCKTRPDKGKFVEYKL